MKKAKEFLKKYLIGFALGVITAISISVIAATYFPSGDVTYDNKESGLESTNVQGAIDELYKTCTSMTASDLIENLEKDPYECRYFFKGATPNNYIIFNNEIWRILSVECDNTIKIIKDDSIDQLKWNTAISNNWISASLNSYLNGTYINQLSEKAQNQITSGKWNIGSVQEGNNNLQDQINTESSKTWNGKIALPTLSEYFRTNSEPSYCSTSYLYNANLNVCKNSTWLYTSDSNWWLLSSYGSSSTLVYNLFSYANVTSDLPVRPTVYLSPDIKITGGNGSQNNPYTLE